MLYVNCTSIKKEKNVRYNLICLLTDLEKYACFDVWYGRYSMILKKFFGVICYLKKKKKKITMKLTCTE